MFTKFSGIAKVSAIKPLMFTIKSAIMIWASALAGY
jgi:hypothetical protein